MVSFDKIFENLEKAKEEGVIDDKDIMIVKKVVETGQMKKAAEELGMPYTTLYTRMQNLMKKGLLPKDFPRLLEKKRTEEQMRKLKEIASRSEETEEEIREGGEEGERPTGEVEIAEWKVYGAPVLRALVELSPESMMLYKMARARGFPGTLSDFVDSCIRTLFGMFGVEPMIFRSSEVSSERINKLLEVLAGRLIEEVM